MTDNKFAILLTTFNGSMFIVETIKSIQNAIQNAHFNIKLFVFDDNSNDDTLELIHDNWWIGKEYIEIHQNEQNLGLFTNKNFGLSKLKSTYQWVFLIHQDDIVDKDWILTGINTINNLSRDDVFVVWSSYAVIQDDNSNALINEGDRRGEYMYFLPTKDNIRQYITSIYTPYSVSGSILNTNLCSSINFFNDAYHHFGDTDFIVRGMLYGYSHLYVALPLLVRRMSNQQASARHKRSARDIYEMRRFFRSFSHILSVKDKFKFKFYLVSKCFRRALVFTLSGKYYMGIKLFKEGFQLILVG